MGKLALSPKQQAKFSKWVRPEEFLDNPQMILAVSSFTIKQARKSDESFCFGNVLWGVALARLIQSF